MTLVTVRPSSADALLMFGLHGRTRLLRIETRARNALALMPDVAGATPHGRAIAPDLPHQPMPAPARHLHDAARSAGVPAALSRDAGNYLCNYLAWQATLAASGRSMAPRLPRSCICRSPAGIPVRAAKASHGTASMTSRPWEPTC